MEKKRDASDLLEYLDSLVEKLRELIAAALAGEDVDAVHDARVITRRLKAASDLVEPIVSKRCRRPFNRVGKSLRRQLGPLRDADVMLEHLHEFKQAKLQTAVKWMRDQISDQRENSVKDATDKTPPARMLARLGSWWGLRHDIEDSRGEVPDLLANSVHLQLDAFIEQAQDLIGERQNDPHQLRIAGKSLRYTLEMAKESGVDLPKSVVSLFKRMQTALGLWHDFVVLAERIMCESVECDLALHHPALQGELLTVAQICLKKSEMQLKKMADLWKTRGQWLADTIRQSFPLTPHGPDDPKAAELEHKAEALSGTPPGDSATPPPAA
jgi:CHAD domain-containing protein